MTTTRIIATGIALALVLAGVGLCNMFINFGLAARTMAEQSTAVHTNALIVDFPGLMKKK